MYSQQFEYRVSQTKKIQSIIEDYVMNGLSHRKLREKYELTPRYLSYILERYVDPEFRRKPCIIRRQKNENS